MLVNLESVREKVGREEGGAALLTSFKAVNLE